MFLSILVPFPLEHYFLLLESCFHDGCSPSPYSCCVVFKRLCFLWWCEYSDDERRLAKMVPIAWTAAGETDGHEDRERRQAEVLVSRRQHALQLRRTGETEAFTPCNCYKLQVDLTGTTRLHRILSTRNRKRFGCRLSCRSISLHHGLCGGHNFGVELHPALGEERAGNDLQREERGKEERKTTKG